MDVVVTPWHREDEITAFLEQWRVPDPPPDWLVLQHDVRGEGCGVTKNRGIARAVEAGADVVVVLDGDCYPSDDVRTLPDLVDAHRIALEPQEVELFQAVTSPPSRGTPYETMTAGMPVAASMGFWLQVGDYCAVRQLAHGSVPMEFDAHSVFWRFFPLCGMNLAFRPAEWDPWCRFVDVPRFDDIWMGWLWQREAYRRGYCFNLAGPKVRHARQSNAWRNLEQEAVHLQANETLWRDIALSDNYDYESLKGLLPSVARGGG